MVELSDVKMRASIQKVEQIVDTVNNFIKTSSYDRIRLDYHIYPKVTKLPKSITYYGGSSPGA